MHSLSIKSKGKTARIELDGFPLEGVTGYELKSSAGGKTELTVKMIVRDLKLGLNEGGDNVRRDFADSI